MCKFLGRKTALFGPQKCTFVLQGVFTRAHVKKGGKKAERTQGPRRGRICLTAGLDLRKSVTMQGATSKMSHNRTVILVVRPLWGRSNEDDLPRRSRPAVMQMRPRWGLFSICPCVRSACRFRSAAEKEQIYRSPKKGERYPPDDGTVMTDDR